MKKFWWSEPVRFSYEKAWADSLDIAESLPYKKIFMKYPWQKNSRFSLKFPSYGVSKFMSERGRLITGVYNEKSHAAIPV